MGKDTLKRLLEDYSEHRARNKALEELARHSNRELRDIGLCRGSLRQEAHKNCPFCKRFSE